MKKILPFFLVVFLFLVLSSNSAKAQLGVFMGGNISDVRHDKLLLNENGIPNNRPSTLTLCLPEIETAISLIIACGNINAAPLRPVPQIKNNTYASKLFWLSINKSPLPPRISIIISTIITFL